MSAIDPLGIAIKALEEMEASREWWRKQTHQGLAHIEELEAVMGAIKALLVGGGWYPDGYTPTAEEVPGILAQVLHDLDGAREELAEVLGKLDTLRVERDKWKLAAMRQYDLSEARHRRIGELEAELEQERTWHGYTKASLRGSLQDADAWREVRRLEDHERAAMIFALQAGAWLEVRWKERDLILSITPEEPVDEPGD